MLIDKIVSNIKDMDIGSAAKDYVYIEWYEAEKKVLHKTSSAGIGIGIRNAGNPLRDGDILWYDSISALIIKICECECLALEPVTMVEMGKACYEMGNRHAPLFIEDGELLTPYDEPLFTALLKCGFKVYKKTARLINPLGGRAGGHTHSH